MVVLVCRREIESVSIVREGRRRRGRRGGGEEGGGVFCK